MKHQEGKKTHTENIGRDRSVRLFALIVFAEAYFVFDSFFFIHRFCCGCFVHVGLSPLWEIACIHLIHRARIDRYRIHKVYMKTIKQYKQFSNKQVRSIKFLSFIATYQKTYKHNKWIKNRKNIVLNWYMAESKRKIFMIIWKASI